MVGCCGSVGNESSRFSCRNQHLWFCLDFSPTETKRSEAGASAPNGFSTLIFGVKRLTASSIYRFNLKTSEGELLCPFRFAKQSAPKVQRLQPKENVASCSYLYRFMVRCFSAAITVLLESTTSPFRARTLRM